MVNKEKITKVDIYDSGGKRILTVKEVFFPKDFFKIKGKELVLIKGVNLPLLETGQLVDVVFEYVNGTRVKYLTTIDIGTEFQINFHLGEGTELEERRRSFKVASCFKGHSDYFIRNEETFTHEEPIQLCFKDINIGGTFFRTSYIYQEGDQVMLSFLDGKVEVISEVLRIQDKNENGEYGYGCKFLNVTQAQEEMIARFIFDCQLAEREKAKKQLQ